VFAHPLVVLVHIKRTTFCLSAFPRLPLYSPSPRLSPSRPKTNILTLSLSLSPTLSQNSSEKKGKLSKKRTKIINYNGSALPVIAKRAWGIVRVIFFILRKGLSNRKLLVDLNMMLKCGNKIASKAIGNLMFHHHHHNDHRKVSFTSAPCEYEFSCSNTPTYSLPFHISKRRHHHHHYNNFFPCAFNTLPTHDDHDMVTISVVNIVLKPGPARRVDPGPGRPGHETGPGLSKNSPGNWPSGTRSTRDPADPVKPG